MVQCCSCIMITGLIYWWKPVIISYELAKSENICVIGVFKKWEQASYCCTVFIGFYQSYSNGPNQNM